MEYEYIKDAVSVKDIDAKHPCRQEFFHFCYRILKYSCHSYETKITIENLILWGSKCNGGIDWLLAKNIIREKEETYKRGDKFHFKNCDDTYVLSYTVTHGIFFINWKTGGFKQINTCKPKSPARITRTELKIASGTDEFKLIPF